MQWRIPLGEARPVNIRPGTGKLTGRLDVGSRRGWLYSQREHPDADELKAAVEQLVETARRS